MSFKIKIKSLGIVKDSEIDFSSFLIFTGQSNTGKSYCALLVYAFVKLISEKSTLNSFFENKNEKFNSELIRDGEITITVKMHDFNLWLKGHLTKHVGALIGNPNFIGDFDFVFEKNLVSFKIKIATVETKNDNIVYGYTINDSEDISYKGVQSLPFGDIFQNVLLKQIFGKIYLRTYIFPPSKASLMGLNFAEKMNISKGAGMYYEFLNDLDEIENFYNIFITDKKLCKEYYKLIEGKVSLKKGQYYYNNDDIEIPITAASSAIKEIAPLIRVIEKFPAQLISLLIEEPEAHLHPSFQIKIADLLAYIANKNGIIQITTHSDYILNRLSNLINLYNAKSKISIRNYNKLCREININTNYFLSPDNVGAYNFEKQNDGSVKIQKLDLASGIPFNSFKSTIDAMINEANIINKFLGN